MLHVRTIIIIAVFSLMVFSCNDSEVKPSTGTLRARSVSHGDRLYQRLEYDLNGNVTTVANGSVSQELDSVEVIYRVVYEGTRIIRTVSESNGHEYKYRYVDNRIAETSEFVNGQSVAITSFFYGTQNRIEAWVTKHVQEDKPVPFQRKIFAYDNAGNTISMELESYDPISKGHLFVSTSRYSDFDDKRNSSALFLNFIHPYYAQFRNNARKISIELANGSTGVTNYEYEYNAAGYSTVQRDRSVGSEVKYEFETY